MTFMGCLFRPERKFPFVSSVVENVNRASRFSTTLEANGG